MHQYTSASIYKTVYSGKILKSAPSVISSRFIGINYPIKTIKNGIPMSHMPCTYPL